MRKVDLLKNTLKCGVLSSNLLNCIAMEEKNNINNIKISNISNEEKENLQNEVTERLKNEYIEEQAFKIIEIANPENLEKYKNPDKYPNSKKIKDNFNKIKDAVIKKIKEKKNNVNKNEIIISNNEEDKKTNIKYFFSKEYLTGDGQLLSHFLIDGIAKYINQSYIFHLFEYDFDLLKKFYDISEEQYKYFNRFVVTVTVCTSGYDRAINDDYNGKVNVEKISEDKKSNLKTVKIIAKKDYLENLFFSSEIRKVLEIKNHVDKYGKVNIKNFFSNCLNLEYINFEGFNTENVVNMEKMFEWCYKLKKLDLSCFNTDRVTNMSSMFEYCVNLEYLNLKSFNTENVKHFSGMFNNCENLKNLDIEHFKFKNAKNCCLMFSGCENLEKINLKNFDFNNKNDISHMFEDCKNLEEVIIGKAENQTEALSISSTINAENMFKNCEKLKYLGLYIPEYLNINNDYMFDKCFKLLSKNFKTNRVDLLLYLIDEDLKKIYIENKMNFYK